MKSRGRGGFAVVSNTTDSPLIGANAHRMALLVTAPNGQRVTLGFGEHPTLDNGPTIAAGGMPLLLTLRDFGQVIQHPIFAIISGAGALPVGFVETEFTGELP